MLTDIKSLLKVMRARNCGLAFTRIDLLVIIAVMALLVLIQLPILANSRTQSDKAICLYNLKQLAKAWLMYADDHDGRLVLNVHGGAAQGTTASGWVHGWLDWTPRTDNTNTLYLIDERWAKIAPYIGKDSQTFKCPADNFLSSAQKARGWTERVRSYSMNSCMGDGNDKQWYGKVQKIYKRIDQFARLQPANAWLLVEEHADCINDACFFVDIRSSSWNWVDLPASYHNGSAGFNFADGHAEIHKWLASTTLAPVGYRSYNSFSPGPDRRDLTWIKERTAEPEY